VRGTYYYGSIYTYDVYTNRDCLWDGIYVDGIDVYRFFVSYIPKN